MNRIIQAAAAGCLIAWGAAAQDPAQEKKARAEIEQQLVKMNLVGSIRGQLVKGMPYAADEITESNHTLGDGTRIHRETKATVYRDSEGRTRRETPENITINDPVAGVTYILDRKSDTVRKLKMAQATGFSKGDFTTAEGKTTFDIRVDSNGPATIVIDGKQLDPKQVQEMIAKAKAEGASAGQPDHMIFTAPAGGVGGVAVGSTITAAPIRLYAGKAEQLGKRNVEGVIAEGTRNTQTIEPGEIGNDRAIQVVNERWYSEELGMMIMTRRSDPRSGEEIFRLTNIRRGDPPAYLFQVPADAHTIERKM